jgi:hypothetical protein
MGTAAQAGMFITPAYRQPAAASAAHPSTSTAAQRLSVGIRLILTAALAAPLSGQQDPPPDLVKRVARQESITQSERNQYTYRQSVTLEELDRKGARAGEYRELRDIIFSPEGTRTEKMLGAPTNTLERLRLTDEDFQDMREIQPFIMNEQMMFVYETKYRGRESMEGMECFVLEVRPRQILHGMRLFEGLLWIHPADYSIVRMEGRAVPQVLRKKEENLFPRFTTIRRPVDGKFWFPVHTHADDTLQFRTGPIRIRLTIRYTEYKRFAAESQIKFKEAP